MSLLAFALAANLALKPAPDATEQDLRCVAALALIIGSQGDKADPGLTAGLLYFVGRLDARAPALDLEAGLRRLLGAADAGEQLKPDMTRCGAILTERGTVLQTIGSSLQGKK
ncbi:MAG: hypothetical protein V4574_19740 [Pseudomonadota bacterium]